MPSPPTAALVPSAAVRGAGTRTRATPLVILALLRHTLVISAYAALTVAMSWPLARDFTTRMFGHVFFDTRHAVWMLWYYKEALVGRAAWPHTTLLYAPHGINTLVDGVGPVNGLLALPFWSLGPIAAFNGAALLGSTLSGWCLYLLARHVGLTRAAALFAGALFIAWPIHLTALYGHLEKLFTGLLPLTMLAGLLAFDLRRRRWTIVLPAIALLATLFQNGNQLTFAVLALIVLAAIQLATAPRDRRMAQAGRIALAGAVTLIVCAPALWPIVRVVHDPSMPVVLGQISAFYMPDAVQLLLPSIHQTLTDEWIYPGQTIVQGRSNTSIFWWLRLNAGWYGGGIETAVNVPIVALALGLVAWQRSRGAVRDEVRRWTIVGVALTICALGPFLRLAGDTNFTRAWFQIPLPEALLLRLPGFDVMRTPGRYMMMASVGLSLVAGFGLMAVARWRGAWGKAIAAALAALAFVECWPNAWPHHTPPPVPAFYRQIAFDRESYGVMDLPAGHGSDLASAYQYYQMTHRKPIAWGYLSRPFLRYPVAGLSSLWDGAVTDYAAARARLREAGYRYIVWHKHAGELLGTARDGDEAGPTGAPTPAEANPFLREAFRGETPVYDDALVTVYRVDRNR